MGVGAGRKNGRWEEGRREEERHRENQEREKNIFVLVGGSSVLRIVSVRWMGSSLA